MQLKHAIVATVLILSMVLSVLPLTNVVQPAPVVAQSSTTSCPSKPFRMTLIAPPNALNMLTMVTGGSSPSMIFMQYMSPIGPVTVSGNVDTSYQLTDWITHNSNYTIWMLHVKPGLHWSDGSNVTANDILQSFGPNFAFNTTYDFAGLHTEVKNQYPLNSSTAVYVLNAPDAQWPQKIKGDYFTTVMPAALISKYGAGAANFGTTLSVGPFYLSNYSAGQFQAKMLRNPYFSPQPHICEIDINFVDSLSQTAAYLQSGSTDFAFVEYSNAKAILSANPNIKLYDEKGLGITDIQWNDTIYPYNMTAFRQAIAYSIDQNAIVQQAFAGYGITAYNGEGAVSPVATQYYNSAIPTYSYSQANATSLLSQVGITKGSDGKMHYSNGSVVTLNLWADTDNTADPQAAAVVQTDLQNLGLVVNLQTTTAANIVGDYGANSNGIRSSMILATTNVAYFGEPYIDSLPGWDVYFLPTIPNIHWLYPPSADAQYQSNASAYSSTTDPVADRQYLFNMEALNARYLPSLVVAYPDKLFAVNTQYYTNYPPGELIYYSYNWNTTGLVNIMPTSANPMTSGSSTNTVSNTSSSTTNTAPQTSSSTTTTSSASATTSSSSSGGGGGLVSLSPLGASIVAAVVVAVSSVLVARRRLSYNNSATSHSHHH